MGMPGRTARKLVSSLLLLTPAVAMFLENAALMEMESFFKWLPEDIATHLIEVEYWVVDHIRPATSLPTDYVVFLMASLIVFLISFGLALFAGWKLGGSRRDSLGVFFSTFLSRYFIGELAVSAYGLFLFVLFAVILTAWLPDAIKMGNPWFVLGTVFYFLSIIFATAFAYPAPKKKEKMDHPKTRYLVYGLSFPSNWDLVNNASCEDMRRNRKINANGKEAPVSLFPLYVSMHYHFKDGPLESLYLLVTKEAHLASLDPPKLKTEVKDLLLLFFEKASKCLDVRFLVRWPSEDEEKIESGPGRTITVNFVPIRDSNDVRMIFQDIRGSRIAELIKENSGDVTFHLTGGTAPMSIAMMLHAIKGDAHAEYARQRVFDVEPNDLLVSVDMDVFDLEDLVRELRDYFERQYEKGEKD
ncbi:PDDEXK family nuclease [Thermococcus cleftensis]|nr:hypothetical protein [Thermococcus cleftensis]